MYNILIDFRETVSYTHWPEIRYTYLSSVFLSIGTTVAILAEVLILLLMAIESSSAKMSDVNLTNLLGILSIPGAFLELRDFRMVLISLGVVLDPQMEEGIGMELDCKFLFLWIFTRY